MKPAVLIEAQRRRLRERWSVVSVRLRLPLESAPPKTVAELDAVLRKVNREREGRYPLEAAGGYYNEVRDILRTIESLEKSDLNVQDE